MPHPLAEMSQKMSKQEKLEVKAQCRQKVEKKKKSLQDNDIKLPASSRMSSWRRKHIFNIGFEMISLQHMN